MEQSLQDLKISGSGMASGGRYNDIKISGSGHITGDVECNDFKTSGSSKTEGSIKAKHIGVSGSSHIIGSVETEEIKISGSVKIDGDVKSANVKISGGAEIEGNLHAEEIDVSGGIKIKNDCEAELFKARGGFSIGGLLNAENVDIRHDGRCTVKEIGGEHIEIRLGNDWNLLSKVVRYLFTDAGLLETASIEGDDIYLEGTQAKIVRGNKITIGRDCRIDRVEYKDSLNIQDNAAVKEQVKL